MPVSRMEQQRRRLYEMCAMAIAAGRADLDGASRVGFDIRSMTRSTPSIVNLGSSVTVTCKYMSPVLPPCLPGLPLPARRIFWPSFTPAGTRVLNFLPLALSEIVAPLGDLVGRVQIRVPKKPSMHEKHAAKEFDKMCGDFAADIANEREA